jgi:hypothetical protein
MIAILYRWKLKEDKVQQFIDGWTEITLILRNMHRGLGSRLHFGDDGCYYAYAQWNSLEDRQTAFANIDLGSAREMMVDAISESFPAVILEIKDDFLLNIGDSHLHKG